VASSRPGLCDATSKRIDADRKEKQARQHTDGRRHYWNRNCRRCRLDRESRGELVVWAESEVIVPEHRNQVVSRNQVRRDVDGTEWTSQSIEDVVDDVAVDPYRRIIVRPALDVCGNDWTVEDEGLSQPDLLRRRELSVPPDHATIDSTRGRIVVLGGPPSTISRRVESEGVVPTHAWNQVLCQPGGIGIDHDETRFRNRTSRGEQADQQNEVPCPCPRTTSCRMLDAGFNAVAQGASLSDSHPGCRQLPEVYPQWAADSLLHFASSLAADAQPVRRRVAA